MSVNFANNNSLSAITALPTAVSGGALNLISTQTASSSSTISFTSGIDSTYKEYIFKFINIHTSSDGQNLQFNFSTDGGSNYNVTKTDAVFRAYQMEDGSASGLDYQTSLDVAQSTGFANLNTGLGNQNDESLSGTLHLFDPSNTTFVKHFIAEVSNLENAYEGHTFTAGYGNTTSAVDAIQFKMSTGNIDSGTITLYGIN
mgnify:CR=1 FL=1